MYDLETFYLFIYLFPRPGRPAEVHCNYSDGMPLSPFSVMETAGINGAYPSLVLVFSPKGDRVCIKNDKLATFQVLRCLVASVHYGLVVVSKYLFCTVQQALFIRIQTTSLLSFCNDRVPNLQGQFTLFLQRYLY